MRLAAATHTTALHCGGMLASGKRNVTLGYNDVDIGCGSGSSCVSDSSRDTVEYVDDGCRCDCADGEEPMFGTAPPHLKHLSTILSGVREELAAGRLVDKLTFLGGNCPQLLLGILQENPQCDVIVPAITLLLSTAIHGVDLRACLEPSCKARLVKVLAFSLKLMREKFQ